MPSLRPRPLRAALLTLAGLTLAAPAAATLDEDLAPRFTGMCQMIQTCNANDTCGTTPAVGDLLVTIDQHGTRMGRNADALEPIDHYTTLEDALPLPPTGTRRRTFLTDLPPAQSARRFAVRVQTVRPETGEPVLRGQYFVLACEAL